MVEREGRVVKIGSLKGWVNQHGQLTDLPKMVDMQNSNTYISGMVELHTCFTSSLKKWLPEEGWYIVTEANSWGAA